MSQRQPLELFLCLPKDEESPLTFSEGKNKTIYIIKDIFDLAWSLTHVVLKKKIYGQNYQPAHDPFDTSSLITAVNQTSRNKRNKTF